MAAEAVSVSVFPVRAVPWYGMGSSVSEAPISEVAINLSGLNWTVSKMPIQTVSGIPIPGRFATVRSTDNRVLGIVSGIYKIVQNHEAFAFTDALLQRNVRYETAGSFQGGKKIWLLAKLEPFDLLGDRVEPYLIFTNSFDANTGVRACITPVRVVCMNTLTLAFRTAKRIWSVRHVGNIEEKLEEAGRTLELANLYLDMLPEVAETMAEINLDPTEEVKFIEGLFPVLNVGSLTHAKNVDFLRLTLAKAYTQTEDIKQFHGTAWGMYNAVVDMATHMPPLRKTKNYHENLFSEVIDGHPLILKAQGLLAEIAA